MCARPTSRTRVVPFVAPSANSYHCVLAADKPLDFAGHLVMLTRQLQVQEADHPQEIERTEEEGLKAACGFGEIGGNCDFTSTRKRPS
jgi:hypothetical protein